MRYCSVSSLVLVFAPLLPGSAMENRSFIGYGCRGDRLSTAMERRV